MESQRQGLKPMGNDYRLVGGKGMYEPELVQMINKGFCEALFCEGEIRFIHANDKKAVRNDIYLGDILARNGAADNAVHYFYAAMKMIELLKANNIHAAEYELELQKRLTKEMYEEMQGLLDGE